MKNLRCPITHLVDLDRPKNDKRVEVLKKLGITAAFTKSSSLLGYRVKEVTEANINNREYFNNSYSIFS